MTRPLREPSPPSAHDLAAPRRFWETGWFSSAVGGQDPAPRIEEPPPRTPLRRGKDGEEATRTQSATRTCRLNGKLRPAAVAHVPALAGHRAVLVITEVLG